MGVCILNALLFGTMPALRASGVDVASALKSGLKSQLAACMPLQKVLVVAQVALSLALLTTAGLFISTMRNLENVDLGFVRDNALLLSVNASRAGYKGQRADQLFRETINRLNNTSGVRSVTVMAYKFMNNAIGLRNISVPGYAPKHGETENSFVVSNSVGPHFFRTAGVSLRAGRDFNERDDVRAPRVAVIDESMARHFFGNTNALGRHIQLAGSKGGPVEVVGVVRDMKYIDVQTEKQDVLFLPFFQGEANGPGTLLIRTSIDPRLLVQTAAATIRSIDPKLTV